MDKRTGRTCNGISIHALREEGDPGRGTPMNTMRGFLSTPSARRATRNLHDLLVVHVISIHALREEGDTCCFGHRTA